MNLAGAVLLLIAIKFCMNYGVELGIAAAIAITTAAAAIELIHKIERFNSGWSVLDWDGVMTARSTWLSTLNADGSCSRKAIVLLLKISFLSLASFPRFKNT